AGQTLLPDIAIGRSECPSMLATSQSSVPAEPRPVKTPLSPPSQTVNQDLRKKFILIGADENFFQKLAEICRLLIFHIFD
ncbi:MAG TPA: hypothetical protein VFG34_00005, partial [Sphingopyxis sp.]|nr:hypothetical protein [Sphingopyxis sp.]